MCIRDRANDDTSWRAVYQGIEGFDFEAGYEYRLRIKAEQLPDPPQDGSSIRYTLLEQISKTPATSVIPDQFFQMCIRDSCFESSIRVFAAF